MAFPELIVAPATPDHLAAIAADDIPAEYLRRLDAGAAALCNEYAWTGLIDDRPAIVAGITVHWRGVDEHNRPCGYGEAWARVGHVPRRAWPEITRRIIQGLDRAADDGVRLIETSVDAGFECGHRWIMRLGFVFACLRPSYGVTGRDAVLYQRIRGAA